MKEILPSLLSPLEPKDHKYSHGVGLIIGSKIMSGAARLAGHAARRCELGHLTYAVPDDATDIYSLHQPGAIVVSWPDVPQRLRDPRLDAVLIGPGLGLGATESRLLSLCLASNKALVLDADALTLLVRDNLLPMLENRCAPSILTPHAGEWERLQDGQQESEWCRQLGVTLIRKNATTTIYDPGGREAQSEPGTATLATMGTGDVLAGMVMALLARGLTPFTAAQTAVWLHNRAAIACGRGLIAEDLPDKIPALYTALPSC